MTQAEFKPVGHSEQRLFGPRKILVCGYPPEQQQILLTAFADLPEFTDLPLIFARSEDAERTLDSLFAQEHQAGMNGASSYPAAVIMAGLTGTELHHVMAEHKKTRLPSPLWATLTPTSATWQLTDLLRELGREKEAMQKMRAKK